MLTGNAIRSKFLEFFKSKGHTIAQSDSVVPKDDPTVLFTTAGMQQFKQQFLGHIDGYRRAASSQKCMRTDDLDQIGVTDFHHTFFEMLGNFSFGDYFKKDAIVWAWEFLTKEVGIPADKLWVSVNIDDTEAKQIWIKDVGISGKRIAMLGDKSNFWPSNARLNGPNGPCGPCSEIFFDFGANVGCGKPDCDPGCDCGRFSEIWNLVFTQFNRKDGGELEPLPAKNIDTGMGLERLTAVLQGKRNNYETDLFAPIMAAIDRLIDADKKLSKRERCVIADHIRAITFAINDGVMPSNEGRGYVVKKLIIDVTDIVILKGHTQPLVHKLVPAVVEAMGDPYPEIAGKAADIAEIIQKVEMGYIQVRKQRIPELLKKGIEIEKNSPNPVEDLGRLFFEYRDTHGLTFSTISASTTGTLRHTVQGLERSKDFMNEQKERSRASSKMQGDVFISVGVDANIPKTKFLGYDQLEAEAKILKVIIGDDSKRVKIVLDQTPFYAESGGQVGDSGELKTQTGKAKILDTHKTADIFIHTAEVVEGKVSEGQEAQASVDASRRQAIMNNHTATHLLQAALREVLGKHVQQQGSLVDDQRLRFDFTHPKAISDEELTKIENRVNTWVKGNSPVDKKVLPIDEAKTLGALSFFAEKYGDVVRVVAIGDYSKEFCGGTHLNSTGEIGLIKIVSEGSVAQGIRRLEARTGAKALLYVEEQKKALEELARKQQEKEKQKELNHIRLQSLKKELSDVVERAPQISGVKVISHTFQDVDGSLLKSLSDAVKESEYANSFICSLFSVGENSVSCVVTHSTNLIQKGIKANELIKDIAAQINGSGGGRPDMAQAGGKDGSKLPAAIDALKKTIIEKLK